MSLEEKNLKIELLVLCQSSLAKTSMKLRENGHVKTAEFIEASIVHVTLGIEVLTVYWAI